MNEREIVLTISILISRKEKEVRRCLDSLQLLREAVSSELILIDTSGDPGIRKLLEKYSDNILTYQWSDDFSQARNIGLKEAKGEWFLFLDDDEYFTDAKEMIHFFQSGEYRQYDAALYAVRNLIDHEGTRWNEIWVSRLAKIVPGMHFEGAIHEYLVPVPKSVKKLFAYVEHTGYVGVYAGTDRKRYDRNTRMIQKMIDQDPDNIHWRIQMIMEYGTYGETEKLFDFAGECIRYFEDSKEMDICNAFAAFYASELMYYQDWMRDDLAYQLCRQALEDSRISRTGQAYFHYYKADLALQRGNYVEAFEDVQFYLESFREYQNDEEEQVFQSNVPFIMNTYQENNLAQAYQMLICAGAKRGDTSLLKRYWLQIERLNPEGIFYPDFPATLAEGLARLEDEDRSLQMIKAFHQNAQLWERVEEAMVSCAAAQEKDYNRYLRLMKQAGLDTKGFEAEYRRNILINPGKELHGTQIIESLKQFAILTEEATERIRYAEEARKIRRLLDASDTRKKIAFVKEFVSSYPQYAEVMKRYAAYLAEQEAGETDTVSNNPEMDQMAKQLIANVQILLQNGMVEQAQDVIAQARLLLPHNPELEALQEDISRRR